MAMLEILMPEYSKQLLESNQNLLSIIASQLRGIYFDEASRLVTRVGYIDDGYVRVRDTSASIDILDMLREFSWMFYNLSEISRNIDLLKNALESVGTDRLRISGSLTFDPNLIYPVYSELISADETSPQSISLDTGGRGLISIYASADATTTIHLDGSNDSTNWFNDLITYSNVTSVIDVVKTSFRYVRLRSDPAGVPGSKITLVLSAKVG